MATVNLKVDLDPSGAIKGLQLIGGETKKTEKDVSSFQSVLQGIGQGFGQELYSRLKSVGGALIGVTSAAADYASKFQDLHDRTGQGVEELQKYSFAAKAAGTDVETVAGSSAKLAKNLYEGTEETVKAVGRLGLSFKDLRNESPDKEMEDVLGAISKLPNPTERSAIAMELLGKGGNVLIPLGGQFKELADQAERLGLVLDKNTVKALDDLGDEVGALTATWEGLEHQIGGVIASSEPLHVLLTGVTDLLGELSGQVKDNRDGLRSFVDDGVVFAAKGLVGLADIVQTGMNVWDALHLTWITLEEQIAEVGIAINKYGEIYSRVFLAGAGASYFKENQVLLEGMRKATLEEANELEASSAKRADSLGKVRGALVELEKKVEESVGKHHAAADAVTKHGGALTNLGKAAEEQAKKLEAVNKALLDQQTAADNALAGALAKQAEGPAEILKAQLDAVEREMEDQIAKGWDQIRDKFKAGEAIPPELIASAQYLEASWRAVGKAKRDAILDEETKKANREEAEADEKTYQERLKRQEDLRQKAANAHAEMLAGLRELAGGAAALGSEIGGVAGGFLQLGAVGLDVFARLNDAAVKHQTTMQKLGGALQGAAAAYKSGSFFGGAAKGAAAGAAFGPWGAAIGFVGGGILGLIGKSKKAREEVEKLRGEITKTYGSMEAAKDAAERLGLHLDKAFDSKNPKELKAAMDQLAKAEEDHKKRLEGLHSAFDGLTLRAKGFMEQLERGSVSTEQLNRYAGQAFATFQLWLKETGDLSGALEMLGPTLDAIAAAQEELGVQAGGGIQALLHMRDVVQANQDVADSLGGITQTMKALNDAGLLTRDLFTSFGQDAAEQFAILQGRGVDTNTALMLMQPTLQQLWEGQKKFGNVTDEATKALLDQAEAQGLVGAQFQSVADKQLDVLLAIAEALGAKIPAGFKAAGDAAEDYGRRAGAAVKDNVVPFPDRGGEGYGEPPAGLGRGGFLGYAARGMVVPPRRGGWAVVGEAGQPEVVAPVAALFGKLSNQIAGQVAAAVGAGSGNQPFQITSQLVIDGKVLAQATQALMREDSGVRAEVKRAVSGRY